MKRRRVKFSNYYHQIIIEELAELYDVKKESIFLGSRKKNIVFAKRMYIFVLRNVFNLTIMEIGEITNLHHASVIHHTRKFEFFYNNYAEENLSFKRIENRIIEVEVDEEIVALEMTKYKIEESLTKLYKIKNTKNEREKRESLPTE